MSKYERKTEDGEGWKHVSPTVQAMYDETPLGRCCVCECRVERAGDRGRFPRICKDPDCKRVWNRVYRMDRSRREGRGVRTSPTEMWERT